ncbi:MAG: hypothetical protein Q8P78_01715 [bacterium]|nr:hypothetical protein [bacterium]
MTQAAHVASREFQQEYLRQLPSVLLVQMTAVNPFVFGAREQEPNTNEKSFGEALPGRQLATGATSVCIWPVLEDAFRRGVRIRDAYWSMTAGVNPRQKTTLVFAKQHDNPVGNLSGHEVLQGVFGNLSAVWANPRQMPDGSIIRVDVLIVANPVQLRAKTKRHALIPQGSGYRLTSVDV